VIGTNPLSLAVPERSRGELALRIDQSASTVAKSEVTAHKRRGEALPEGWALDADGKLTTDPDTALAGSMVPAGGTKGGPPQTEQCFIAIDPGASGENHFDSGLGRLIAAIEAEPEVRLPGLRRLGNRVRHERDGVMVDSALLERIEAIAEGGGE